jgi:uncharacterized protein (DUF58 family)
MSTPAQPREPGTVPPPAAAAPDARGKPGGPGRGLVGWLHGRLPTTDSQLLTQRNIYILPTRAGLAFAATLVLMLLASINYQLNLGYALTFLLAGAGIVSMHQTHGTLRGLTLHLRPPPPVHAGEPALLEVVITNPGAQRHALALRFVQPAAPMASESRRQSWTDVPAQGQDSVHLSLVPEHRGWQPVPVIVCETVFPFGLFRAWTLWRPASRVLAWPRPERPAPALPSQGPVPEGEIAPRRSSGSEMDGVRAWRRGDTLRQVVWKKVARSGELVSRETAGSASRELWLDWSDPSAAAGITGPEARLSRLTAWVLAAEREGLGWGLRLPGRELSPAQGEAHRRAALEALALWR